MTDISGPLAHQMPLHNHRGGLVQPSLVMNHHLDMECHGADIRISKFNLNHLLLICNSNVSSLLLCHSIMVGCFSPSIRRPIVGIGRRH